MILPKIFSRFKTKKLAGDYTGLRKLYNTEVSLLEPSLRSKLKQKLTQSQFENAIKLYQKGSYDDLIRFLTNGKFKSLAAYNLSVNPKLLSKSNREFLKVKPVVKPSFKENVEKLENMFKGDHVLSTFFKIKSLDDLAKARNNSTLRWLLLQDKRIKQLSKSITKSKSTFRSLGGIITIPVLVIGGGISIERLIDYSTEYIKLNTGCFLFKDKPGVIDQKAICKLSNFSCKQNKINSLVSICETLQVDNLKYACKPNETITCKNCQCLSLSNQNGIQCPENTKLGCKEATVGEALTFAIVKLGGKIKDAAESGANAVFDLIKLLLKYIVYIMFFVVCVMVYGLVK
jgi:hypothetical protein